MTREIDGEDRNSTRPGPPPKPTKGGISTGLKVGGLTKAQSSDDALRAENERLRAAREADAVKLLAALEDSRQEVERLRAALAEIYAGGEVSLRAWQLANIAGKALQ